MNYPDGLYRLPDEELVPCDCCSHRTAQDSFKECTKCGQDAVCPQCEYCNYCNTSVEERIELLEEDEDE